MLCTLVYSYIRQRYFKLPLLEGGWMSGCAASSGVAFSSGSVSRRTRTAEFGCFRHHSLAACWMFRFYHSLHVVWRRENVLIAHAHCHRKRCYTVVVKLNIFGKEIRKIWETNICLCVCVCRHGGGFVLAPTEEKASCKSLNGMQLMLDTGHKGI